MRKPEEIIEEIHKLKEELKASKEYYDYTLLCDDKHSDDMIVFFNMKKARVVLTALTEGKELQLRHGVYGNVDVWMNPQRNRILVGNNKHINENNILTFVLWAAGDWYIKE